MPEYTIVLIDEDDNKPPFKRNIREPDKVSSSDEAWNKAKKFIGLDETLTTFWGTWQNERVLFLANDNGMALNLFPNTPATLAYLDQCIPGTMHVILGPVVALVDKELW
jgi:hypothetical protein